MKITKDILKQMIAEQMSQLQEAQKDYDKISQARLDGATDYREGRGMEDNAEKWQEVDNGIYFTDYEDGFFDAQEAEDYELDEGFTYDTMTPEEKKKGIEREERMIAAEEERLKKSLASAESDAQRALAQKIYKRNKEQSEKIIARLKGEAVPAKPDPDAINPDFDRDYDEYGRVYQESKKDVLKNIVAEELAKMNSIL